MLANILVLAFVTLASCQNHGYSLKAVQHEVPKDYSPHHQRNSVHMIQVHEDPESEEVQYKSAPIDNMHYKHIPVEEAYYRPTPEVSEGQHQVGHAYSSQSVYHHAGLGNQDISQDSGAEHVAPVYQYVQEEEEPAHHSAPVQHYQNIRYPVQQEEEPAHHSAPVQHYQNIRYPVQQEEEPAHHSAPVQHYQNIRYPVQQEEEPAHHSAPVQHYQNIRYPVQQEIQSAHYPNQEIQSYQPHRAQAHYVQPHEGLNYHHANPHEANIHHKTESSDHDPHDEPIDYYAHPKYQYEYNVEDPHTGDKKFQQEFRDGDVVKGVYSFHEADGSIRTVEYSSDKHKGFNAVVKHSVPGKHIPVESHQEK